MTKKYCVGIDLGTSNSCLSLCVPEGTPELIAITQIISPGVRGEKELLPSTLYLPATQEFASGSIDLPWGPAETVIGYFAREHGGLVPDRLVSSAKSWLCNANIDRYGEILPWGSELESGKVSPYEASRCYLEHLRSALEQQMKKRDAGFQLSDCHVVLTVPASFDEVARGLTHQAAQEAGWGSVNLLEEPQSAFYAWIAKSESGATASTWNQDVVPGDLVLVCDVGGGTADFSLIAVAESTTVLSGNLELHRIAVGEHILLGGDNMDLALAYTLKAQIEEAGQEIDQWQFLALVHAARKAKEQLLTELDLQAVPIAVPSRSASLFAKTISTQLNRDVAMELILDGYFPLVDCEQMPAKPKAVGLQEFGLEYAADPALSKHLARFLMRSRQNVQSDENLLKLVSPSGELPDGKILQPTAVLFNGGVFQADILRERILQLLNAWSTTQQPVRELQSAGLDTAVANGAAYYGAVQLAGSGIKIRAGTSRSFYLGLAPQMLAVPGFKPAIKGLCLVPQGTEEGTQFHLNQNEFGLVTGEPVEFRLFCSEVRAGDRLGDKIDNAEKVLDELPSLTIALPPVEGETQQIVPVTLNPIVTDVGTLELWMRHTQSEQRWKLEFNLRPQ